MDGRGRAICVVLSSVRRKDAVLAGVLHNERTNERTNDEGESRPRHVTSLTAEQHGRPPSTLLLRWFFPGPDPPEVHERIVTFTGTIVVTIASPVAWTSVRYTRNGSPATANSRLFRPEKPIEIRANSVTTTVSL